MWATVTSLCNRCRNADRPTSPTDKVFIVEGQYISMPAAAGCTNCYTKYSLFTKEYGCPKCHLSFCKKCLSKKAILPGKTTIAVPVCPECYGKLSQPIPPPRAQHIGNVAPPPYDSASVSSSSGGGGISQNWWGEGLPPPSMRTQTNPQPWTNIQRQMNSRPDYHTKGSEVKDLEDRHSNLRKEDPSNGPAQACSLSDIENRLAALRGCDVELVRNPRAWFTSTRDEPMESDTADGLLRMANDRVRIENQRDDDIEQRYNRLKIPETHAVEDTEPSDNPTKAEDDDFNNDNRISAVPSEMSRFSAVSGDTEFSEATKEELAQIKELMSDAEKRLLQSKQKEYDTEMKTILAETRRESQDLEKINDEIESFYNKRLDKVKLPEDEENDSDESLDDETLRKIVLEAELAETEEVKKECEQEMGKKEATSDHVSPTKGFLGRIFKK